MIGKFCSITKFVLLMLAVGILPDLVEIPLPVVLVLFALVLLTTPLVPRFFALLSRLAWVRARPRQRFTESSCSWQVLLPEAPGTRGTVRSRAPSRLVTAFA